jgi:hypothetical protein
VQSIALQRGDPRCWSVFPASANRKGGGARTDDLQRVQRQGPGTGDLHSLPQGNTDTTYFFLRVYLFLMLLHSPAFNPLLLPVQEKIDCSIISFLKYCIKYAGKHFKRGDSLFLLCLMYPHLQ